MYVMGVDGGGTKTKCYVGNTGGEVLGRGLGGPANYQICGKAMATIEPSIKPMALARKATIITYLRFSGGQKWWPSFSISPLVTDWVKTPTQISPPFPEKVRRNGAQRTCQRALFKKNGMHPVLRSGCCTCRCQPTLIGNGLPMATDFHRHCRP